MNKRDCYVDSIYRNKILSCIIDYAYERNIQFSLEQMASFDPMYNENYAQNFENFVRDDEQTFIVSPDIQAKMPTQSKTFIQKNGFEIMWEEFKKLFK